MSRPPSHHNTSRPHSKGGSKRQQQQQERPSATFVYKGGTERSIRSGEGLYKYPEGGNSLYSYTGEYASGVKSKGIFKAEGAFEYSGEFDGKGEISGKGTKTWTDGRSYCGYFVNGEMSGHGVWTSADGSEVYEGEMSSNKWHGRGVLRRTLDDTTYSGDFKDHKMSGSGTFLKTNNYVIESDNFSNNIIDGSSGNKVLWSKVATYDGAITNGHMQGPGLYSTLDGSYEFEGEFIADKPDPYRVGSYMYLAIDRSRARVFESAHTEPIDPKKAPKKPDPKAAAAAASPGDPPVVTLQPGYGGEIGDVVVSVGKQLSPEEVLSLQTATAAAAPVVKGKPPLDPSTIVIDATPRPADKNSVVCEKKRVFTVTLKRLENADMTPADARTADTSALSAAPLWLRKKTLRDFAFASTRFPPSAITYSGGSSSASTICSSELEDLLATGVIASRGEYASDIEFVEGAALGDAVFEHACDYCDGEGPAPTSTETIKCFEIGSVGSSISVVLKYQQYKSAEQEMCFFADFSLQPPGDEAASELSRDVVVLSLQRMTDGARGAERLQLVLAVPTSSEDSHMWRLQTVTEAPLVEGEEIPSTSDAGDASARITIQMCSWSHGSSITTNSRPHSVCLCISTTGATLTVDGDAGRIMSTESSEAAMAAWLPVVNDPVVEVTDDDDAAAAAVDAESVPADASSEPAPAEAEPPAARRDNRLLLSVGGSGFFGKVLLVAATSRKDRASASLVTGAYCAHDEYEREYARVKSEERRLLLADPAPTAAVEDDAEAACASRPVQAAPSQPPVPYGYTCAAHATVTTVCGAGVASNIFLPSDAAEGLYIVEVTDDSIPDQCLSDVSETPEEGGEAVQRPEALGACIRAVRRIGGVREVVKVARGS